MNGSEALRRHIALSGDTSSYGKDCVALELYRLGLIAEVQHMVQEMEWDWDDAVAEALARKARDESK